MKTIVGKTKLIKVDASNTKNNQRSLLCYAMLLHHFWCAKKREAESVENGNVCRGSGEVSFPTDGGGCGLPRQILFPFLLSLPTSVLYC